MKYGLTLGLGAILVVVYLAFSSGFFIPDDLISALGFSLSNLAGVVSYSFLHISLQHLLGNLFLLIPLGLVVEPVLLRRDFLAIYLLSGTAAAFLFAALVPNVLLVGASAAIAGLLIPACLISIKRTVFNIAVFTLAAVVLIWAANSGVAFAQSGAQQKAAALNENISSLNQEKNKTLADVAVVEQKYWQGEISQQAYEQAKQELGQRIAVINNQSQQVSDELNKTAAFVAEVEAGKKREQESQTSAFVHLLGSFVGLAYVAAFRRDVLWKSGDQVAAFVAWAKKLKRPKKVKKARRPN